jgi:hypothetical protein
MLKLIGAVMAMLATNASGGSGRAPIFLTTQPVDGGVRIEVIGAPTSEYEASFQLEVVSPSGRSQHRGSSRIHGGDRATLSSVTVGVPANGAWRARLRVEPAGAEPYEQMAGSPAR